MTNKIYYWKGAIGLESLLNNHADDIRNLLTGNYQNNDLEKLSGSGSSLIYSYRLNDTERLLFTTRTIKKQAYLQVLEHLPTHDYQKSRYLKKGVLKRENNRNQTTLDELVPEFQPVTNEERPLFTPATETRLEPIGLDYFNQQFIQISPTQSEALQAPFPVIILGIAGSGKSFVSLPILSQFIANNSTQGPLRILYVSKEQGLVDKMAETWAGFISGQDIPEHVVVEFKTYNEIAFNDHLVLIKGEMVLNNQADQAFFDSWINHHKKYLDGLQSKTIYQEFRICSGFSSEAYYNLGERQSSIPKEQRQALYAMYDKYCEHLHAEAKIDPAFSSGKPIHEPMYDLIVEDEAQNSSLLQQHYLFRLAKNNTIALCMDPHQNQTDSCSTRTLLEQSLWSPTNPQPVTTITLDKTYRCPPVIAQVADVPLGIKHAVTGGKIDKQEASAFIADDSFESPGHVVLTSERGLRAYSKILEQADSNHFAVVTRPDLLAKAEMDFNTPLVFTPETIQGLEYPTVLIYQLVSDHKANKIFKDIKPILNDLQLNTQRETHRAKEGQADTQHAPWLNQIHTAYTRASNTLVICEEINRDNAAFFNLIQERMPTGAVSNCQVCEAQPDKTDWHTEAIKHSNLNQVMAIKICKQKLNMTNDEAARFLSLNEPRKSAYKFPQLKRSSTESRTELCLHEIALATKDEVKHPAGQPRSVDNSELDVPRLVRGIQIDLALCNKSIHYSKSLDPADKPRDVGSVEMNCQQPLKKSPTKLPKLTLDEERLLELVNDFSDNRLEYTLNGSNQQALRLLFYTPIKTEPAYSSLFQYITQSENRVHMFCNVIHHLATPTFINNIIDAKAPAPINETACAILALYNPKLLRKKKGNAIEIWSRTIDKQKILTQCLIRDPLFYRRLCSETYDFFTPLELGRSLSQFQNETTQLTQLLYISSTPEGRHDLDRLFGLYPEIFKYIQHETLSLASTQGIFENISPLFCLGGSKEGRTLIRKWFDKYPAAIKHTPPAAWGLYPTKGIHNQVSPLFWYAAQPDGREFISMLFNIYPDIIINIPPESWGLSPAQDEDIDTTPLYWFAQNTFGQCFLRALLETSPDLFRRIPYSTWSLAPETGDEINKSPLFWLSGSSEGFHLLIDLFDVCPDIFINIPGRAWSLAPLNGPYKHLSPLLFLTNTVPCALFLMTIFHKYPAIIAAITPEGWNLEPTHKGKLLPSPIKSIAKYVALKHMDCSVLQLLFDNQPAIFDNLLSCTDDAYDTLLQWMSQSKTGRVIINAVKSNANTVATQPVTSALARLSLFPQASSGEDPAKNCPLKNHNDEDITPSTPLSPAK